MKSKFYVLGMIIACFFSSCTLSAYSNAPYSISGEMVLEESSNYSNAGFDFTFYNSSEKKVKEFTVVFYLFDEDGEPPLAGKNNIVFNVASEVDAYTSVDLCVSLDKYLTYVPEVPFTVDFLYISEICYEDDSSWSDPFGLRAFQ